MRRQTISRGVLAYLLALLICAMCAVVIYAVLAIKPAHAHDHTNPKNNEWLESLHNGQGVPCCDGSDALRIDDVDWQTVCEAGTGQCHYQVHLEGAWWNVPEESVIHEPNRIGPALVWPVFYGTKGRNDWSVFIRCFEPGAGT
jgi:hypothetical protein